MRSLWQPSRRVLRSDDCAEGEGGVLEFRLTYAGPLFAHRDDGRLRGRSVHVHAIRRHFHKQLAALWAVHPGLEAIAQRIGKDGPNDLFPTMRHDGFVWQPIVSDVSGLVCKVEVLLLRHGAPGHAIHDVDNRLKTLFDALRKAKNVSELGAAAGAGLQVPQEGEEPFYVLLEDDRLITDIAVTTDQLLEPVPGVDKPEDGVRLVVHVHIQPYKMMIGNLILA